MTAESAKAGSISLEEIVREGRGSAREVALSKILNAANGLFIEHGFHQTSVRMIADSAGVSMGSLYRYIRQKEDLVFLAAAFPAAEVRARLSAVPSDLPARERISRLFSEYVDVIDHHRDELRMLNREIDNLPKSRSPEIRQMTRWTIEQFERCIADGVANGQIEPCDQHILAVALHALAHTWSERARQLEDYDFETFAKAQLQNALRIVPFAAGSAQDPGCIA
jgi:AcrR family transcriptional regulator